MPRVRRAQPGRLHATKLHSYSCCTAVLVFFVVPPVRNDCYLHLQSSPTGGVLFRTVQPVSRLGDTAGICANSTQSPFLTHEMRGRSRCICTVQRVMVIAMLTSCRDGDGQYSSTRYGARDAAYGMLRCLDICQVYTIVVVPALYSNEKLRY